MYSESKNLTNLLKSAFSSSKLKTKQSLVVRSNFQSKGLYPPNIALEFFILNTTIVF